MIDEKSAAEARDEMLRFVEETHDWLRRFTNELYDSRGRLLILEEMVDELRAAWASFNDDFSWDRAKIAIYEAPQERLQTHGLYGSQLRAKLTLVRTRTQRFLDNITKKQILMLIDAIDTLLNSIIAATGLDEAIKELKDLLRNSVDEEEQP